MASGGLGVVNLHISCGLGNAMGMLYNAYREGTPLLVTAGQQDRRLMFEEPILWGQMVEVARPWTKWACEVQRVQDLPVGRPPRGADRPHAADGAGVPVAAGRCADGARGGRHSGCRKNGRQECLPHCPTPASARRWTRSSKPPSCSRSAKNPAILAGSRVTERGAMAELVAVAEALGAPVITESGTTHGRLAFPSDHPLNAGGLPLWSPEVRERLDEYDVVLVVGMDLLRQYIYFEPARAIPEHIQLVQIDEDPWQLGKNYPVEVGVIGDTKTALAELHALFAGGHDAGTRRQSPRASRARTSRNTTPLARDCSSKSPPARTFARSRRWA